MPEFVRLRRRARFLLVLCLLFASLAAYGWFWRAPRGAGAATSGAAEEGDLEGFRKRISRAGQAQRLRVLRRLVRHGGRQAVARVIEMLRSARSEAVRVAAVEQLGALGSRAAVEELSALARGDQPRLVEVALRALGRCGSREAARQLVELLDVATVPRRQLFAALGEVGGADALAELTRLAQDTDEPHRRAAVEALGRTGQAQAVPVLRSLAMKSDNRALQRTAVAALGDLGHPDAQRALLRLARGSGASPSTTLRQQAVAALGKYTSEEVQVFLGSLVKDDDRAVARAALNALGRSDSPLATRALAGALGSPRPELRLAAARALAKAGNGEGRKALLALVGGQQGAEAARALAKLKGPEARQELLALARGGSISSQRHVLAALSGLRGPDVEATLDDLRKSATPQVAAQALGRLAQLQGAKALPTLERAFREGSNYERRAALRQLVKLGHPRLQKLLRETASNSGDHTLRHTALAALVKRGGPEAKRLMLDMYKNGDRNLRTNVAYYLPQVGGAEAREALLKQLRTNSHDYSVRYALGRMNDPKSRERLQGLLHDPSLKGNAKIAVVQVLAQQKDGASLLAAMNHPDKGVRRAALNHLGGLGGAAAEQALIDASRAGEGRSSALQGLARLATPRALDALGQALHDDKHQGQAAKALARNGSKRAIDAIANSFRGANDSQRKTLIGALGYARGNPHARKLLVEALDDSDDGVAASAASFLARYGGRTARPRLLSLMQSGRKRVRYVIAQRIRWSSPSFYKQHKELIDEITRSGG